MEPHISRAMESLTPLGPWPFKLTIEFSAPMVEVAVKVCLTKLNNLTFSGYDVSIPRFKIREYPTKAAVKTFAENSLD